MSDANELPIVDVSTLDEPTRAALERHILTLADTKRLLGIRYSDWLLGAPSIETGIAASSMCQDEWGHARLLYAMLKDLGSDPQKAEQDRGPQQYQSVDGLDAEFPDWAWVIAATVVIDAGASAALRGLSVGGLEVAQTRVPKMLAEEAFHQDFGSAWVRKVATGSPAAKTAVAEAARALLPRTLAWMAPDDDRHALLVSAGLCEDGPAVQSPVRRVGGRGTAVPRYRRDQRRARPLRLRRRTPSRTGTSRHGSDRAGQRSP